MQKIILILLLICFSSISYSQAADEYFRTLRNDKVNLRQGPSFEYPIKILYKKKFLPVLILDSSDNFRKIRDHENNTGWIHRSQLSKNKAAIVIDGDLIMFNSPTIYSNPLAILKKGRLVKIDKCKKTWCKARTSEFKGWIKNDSLWGLF
jgi:SH3-like domain-containing protein